MPPKLSIITPCLNAQETIRATIESVLQQADEGIEYIIIDGGSTDETLGIIKEYTQSIDHIISEPDKGISDAFNKGVALAQGEYIGIINADDYYAPNAFDSILQATTSKPDVIHGSLRYLSAAGNSYEEHPDLSQIWRYMSIFHPTMFVHRKAYQSIGTYRLDMQYAMDSEWVHRAIAQELKFTQAASVIATMRLGGRSHRYLLRSLIEFRRSAILHGAGTLLANYYFLRQLSIQSLLKINWIKAILLYRRGN